MRKTRGRIILSMTVMVSAIFCGPGMDGHAVMYTDEARRKLAEAGIQATATCPSVGNLWSILAERSTSIGGAPAPNTYVTSKGTAKILAVPVQFQVDTSDTTTGSGQFTDDTTTVKSKAQTLMARLTTHYSKYSYGKLTVSGTVYDTLVTAPKPMFFYAESTANLLSLIDSVASRIDTWVNFGQYDGIIMLHAGANTQITGTAGDLSAHFSQYGDTYTDRQSGDTVRHYVLASLEAGTFNGKTYSTVGTICHEFGHMLGLPDLYDPCNNYKGVGDWDLMASGVYMGAPRGETPAMPSPWCREYLGWSETVVISASGTPVSVSMEVAETSAKIYKIYADTSIDTEYYLLEYRSPSTVDVDCVPAPGILIWHVDNSIGSVQSNTVNCYSLLSILSPTVYHNRVDFVEADYTDVNYAGSNSCQPWPGTCGKQLLATNTLPNSKSYFKDTAIFAVRSVSTTSSAAYASVDFTNIWSTFEAKPIKSSTCVIGRLLGGWPGILRHARQIRDAILQVSFGRRWLAWGFPPTGEEEAINDDHHTKYDLK